MATRARRLRVVRYGRCTMHAPPKNAKHGSTPRETRKDDMTEAKELPRFISYEKRVSPPWSAPRELWYQTLLPIWKNKKGGADGAVTQKLGTLLDILTRALLQIIATRHASLLAHRSRGAHVAKPNGNTTWSVLDTGALVMRFLSAAAASSWSHEAFVREHCKNTFFMQIHLDNRINIQKNMDEER